MNKFRNELRPTHPVPPPPPPPPPPTTTTTTTTTHPSPQTPPPHPTSTPIMELTLMFYIDMDIKRLSEMWTIRTLAPEAGI